MAKYSVNAENADDKGTGGQTGGQGGGTTGDKDREIREAIP